MRAKIAGLPQIGSPSTRIVPWLGLSWPVINFMNVDLPAPLGPSSPVMPGGIETVTLLRPLTCPYHFDTPSAWTKAPADGNAFPDWSASPDWNAPPDGSLAPPDVCLSFPDGSLAAGIM